MNCFDIKITILLDNNNVYAYNLKKATNILNCKIVIAALKTKSILKMYPGKQWLPKKINIKIYAFQYITKKNSCCTFL